MFSLPVLLGIILLGIQWFPPLCNSKGLYLYAYAAIGTTTLLSILHLLTR